MITSKPSGAFPASSILVVDDHHHIHEAVKRILKPVRDLSIAGHAVNGMEAIRFCEAKQPDVILMDIVMPVMDGLEATRILHGKYPAIKILALSSFQDHESVYALLNNGAAGYLTKSSLTNELIPILRATVSGAAVFTTEVMQQFLTTSRSVQSINKFNLTDRELEVLVFLADGMQNQQMANALEISLSTVKFHKTNIFRKLGVTTRSQALVTAVKNNLI